jgi:hypothetical protein
MEDISLEAKRQQERAKVYREEAEELFARLNSENSASHAQGVAKPVVGLNNLPSQPPPAANTTPTANATPAVSQRGGATANRRAKADHIDGVLKSLGTKITEINAVIKEKRKPKMLDCSAFELKIKALEKTLGEKEEELQLLQKSLNDLGVNWDTEINTIKGYKTQNHFADVFQKKQNVVK